MAIEVAQGLGIPAGDLDVLVVRKVGAPWNPEFGVGAVGEGDVAVIDTALTRELGIDDASIASIRRRESAEVSRRVAVYRGGRAPTPVRGREVILVDDGIATGSTLKAAVAVLRERGARRIVLAAPVASAAATAMLRTVADDVVVLDLPADFRAVGLQYRDFGQVPDAEVVAALERFHSASVGSPLLTDREVAIPMAGTTVLAGQLTVPEGAPGVVVFAHGSGSSRHSSRNIAVARMLHARGCATLLFDLLTETEATERQNVFDIELLAQRLLAATDWLCSGAADATVASLPVGFFGASTGGGAALVAAATSRNPVAAVVSRGGRPDLAGAHLPQVQAPTLLIVGSRDSAVVDMNLRAQERLTCENRLAVVPGATHLFGEPGALEQVGELAGDWFSAHF